MILVIDDDIGIRTSLSMMLRRAHYEVQAVASPKEAMTVIREQETQLIMLDMNFSLSTSGDEGLTLLKQIKLFHPTVPVILMTAWGSINLAVKGMRAGAFDFITKPWNNVALMERVEKLRQGNEPLPVGKKFGLIYADPAWDYLPECEVGYPTMSTADICAMRVPELAEDDAVLAMWVPAGQLAAGLEVVKAWGF